MNSRFKLVIVTSSTFLVVLLLLGAALGRSASPEDAYRHLAVYTEVLSRIKSEYVQEPDIKNVTLGALNGMLESIDPFASYLSAEQYKQYQKNHDPQKSNVGLTLSRRFGYVGIVSVLPGTSAAKAGLTTGDMLEAINGVATRDMPLAYAEMLLAGEPGSSLEVSVLRLRKPEPQKITLTRAVPRYPAVISKLLPDQIGLVQVPALDSGKVKDVAAQIDSLQKQGARKFILDIRNDAIGKPEDGFTLANLFLQKGLMGYLQGQKTARQDFNADASAARYVQQPLVLITNRGTAGAVEVAAAALLDNKRAEVVGERTYGDAAVRRPITMEDGAAVILSVAKYYSPGGKAIQDTGVTPNHPVTDFEAISDDDDSDSNQPETKRDDDPLLKRAIEVLTGAKASAPAASGAKPETPRQKEPGSIITPDKPLK
jgi:carboxyl-terminal processing protease